MTAKAATLHILIGLDDSDSARAAIAHVASVFAGPAKPRLTLLHVLVQAIPPSVEFVDPSMIWDGAGLPPAVATETQEQIEQRKQAARSRAEQLVSRDLGDRWPPERLGIEIVEGGYTRAAIAEIITYHARELEADVVVVGRTRHGALHDALIRSTGERLVHACKATAVWVVGAAGESQ